MAKNRKPTKKENKENKENMGKRITLKMTEHPTLGKVSIDIAIAKEDVQAFLEAFQEGLFKKCHVSDMQVGEDVDLGWAMKEQAKLFSKQKKSRE